MVKRVVSERSENRLFFVKKSIFFPRQATPNDHPKWFWLIFGPSHVAKPDPQIREKNPKNVFFGQNEDSAVHDAETW